MAAKAFKTTKRSIAFGHALRAQLDNRSQGEFGRAVAKAEGRKTPYSQSQVSDWVNGKEPSPSQAIAIEQALGVSPGMLTSVLGFVSTDYQQPQTVEDAINFDRRLGPTEREALRGLYRSLAKVPPAPRRRSPS